MRLMTECDRLRSNELGQFFLLPAPIQILEQAQRRKEQADQQHASEPKLPPLFLPAKNHISLRSRLAFGQRERDDLARKDLSYLFRPPAGITTDCLPDFFPM